MALEIPLDTTSHLTVATVAIAPGFDDIRTKQVAEFFPEEIDAVPDPDTEVMLQLYDVIGDIDVTVAGRVVLPFGFTAEPPLEVMLVFPLQSEREIAPDDFPASALVSDPPREVVPPGLQSSLATSRRLIVPVGVVITSSVYDYLYPRTLMSV